jgi:outer membrane protein
MNKNLLFILTIFFVIKANAQTENGKFIIGAASNLTFETDIEDYNGVKVMDVRTTYFDFKPAIGYLIVKNLEIGLSCIVTYTGNIENNENGNYLNNEFTTFAFFPFAKYYFGSSKLKPFVQFSIGSVNRIDKENMYGIEIYSETFTGFGIEGGFGISAFIANNISLDAMASYGYYSMNHTEDSKMKMKTGALGLNIGFSVFLGK